MAEKIKELFTKYRETVMYVIFGGLTTVVDFLVFFILNDVIKLPSEDLSNLISQICAMVFAFITNKVLVFNSKEKGFLKLLAMFVSFAGFRCITIFLNSALFFIFCTKLGINEYIVKILVSVIIVILNYIFSKLVVFKKKK